MQNEVVGTFKSHFNAVPVEYDGGDKQAQKIKL